MNHNVTEPINGILMLFHHPIRKDANTIMEHVNSFKQYSQFAVWNINTELGFPQRLMKQRFKIIILHYSLFGTNNYCLSKKFLEFLSESKESYKIVFFQDEYHFCQQRFAFINKYKINCVYTLFEQEYFKDVYLKYTNVEKVLFTLTGYVSDDLIDASKKFYKEENERQVDIGYRARKLPFYMGRGAQEKAGIAIGFKKLTEGKDLTIDIETDEYKRIYGLDWYKFLGNCRGVLGVESGVSIVDIDDEVMAQYQEIIKKYPDITFEEISMKLLYKWEDKIPYRAISPRIFEAAALKVCQIMFEGKYNGVVQPMVHYIALKKDFSNLEDVMTIFQDEMKRRGITENAYNDLILSGRYSYERFIKDFDMELGKEGFSPMISGEERAIAERALNNGLLFRKLIAMLRWPIHNYFPGKIYLKKALLPLLNIYKRHNIRKSIGKH